MDSTIQLKTNLISRIQNSNDLNLLKALQTIFESTDSNYYDLNDSQLDSIKVSREQIKKGDFIESEKAILEMRTWLKNQ